MATITQTYLNNYSYMRITIYKHIITYQKAFNSLSRKAFPIEQGLLYLFQFLHIIIYRIQQSSIEIHSNLTRCNYMLKVQSDLKMHTQVQ